MTRFIAIPVAQGDAFYLEREDFSVLVDGGLSRPALPQMFQAFTKRDGVNVIICTHNDADHANGLLGFLDAGLRCGELWLPGRWLAALPDVLRPFVEVFFELTDNVAETESWSSAEKPQPSLSPIEVYAERVHDSLKAVPADNEGPSLGEDGWPESHFEMFEHAEPWEIPPYSLGLWPPEGWPFLPYHRYQKLGPAGIQLLWSAIDAAGRIRDIAIKAFHRGIPVRWFEFNTAKPFGSVAVLQPINAREVTRVRPRVGKLLVWLALTVSNKESLVFWSPPVHQIPGVLFTADSDLDGIRVPPNLHYAIATAPHHGSEANAKAYTTLQAAAQNCFSSITWVRSDGRFRARPGPTYLGLASRRLCTLCRLSANMSSKQAVHLFSRGALWTRSRATAICSCK